jgi:hypothetical protein
MEQRGLLRVAIRRPVDMVEFEVRKVPAMSNWHDATRCSVDQDDVAGLALCILTGRERADALLHVEFCTRCSSELDGLSIVVDRLLELAPHVEPPLGFEVRLLERFVGAEPGHDRGSARH